MPSLRAHPHLRALKNLSGRVKSCGDPNASFVPVSLFPCQGRQTGTHPVGERACPAQDLRWGRLKKNEESQREVQTWHSWEAEPLISPCFKPPWKWGQWEFSSPPQSICLSNGVSWGQGSAVAQAENDVKGGRVPSVPLPSLFRVCSHLVLVFFGQNPTFESFQGASRRHQCRTPWQLLLGPAGAASWLSGPCRC